VASWARGSVAGEGRLCVRVCVCVHMRAAREWVSQVEAQTSRGSSMLQQGWGVVAVAPPSEQLYSESPSRRHVPGRRLVVPGPLLGGDDSTTIANRIGCLHAVFDLCALTMLA
jgi:hypothetical protein